METSGTNSWTTKSASVMASICLLTGIAIGYLVHGPNVSPTAAVAGKPQAEQQVMTPEAMQQASAKATGSVLEQLKSDPKNFALLVKAGDLYYHHGSFDQASTYYSRALEVQNNEAVRTQYASALFYQGKADESLQQYGIVLDKNPKSDVALFNSGIIKLKAKNDPKGAVELWQKLLAAYPNHPQRAVVEKMIERASKQQS